MAGVFACALPQAALAQYSPPPMFEDQTPPMVRPEAHDGYIVEPKVSPNTVLPETMDKPYRPPVITPRVSVDPDSGRAAPRVPAPAVQPAPAAPAAPSPVPASPQIVAPKPAPTVQPVVPVAPKAPVPPPAVAAPTTQPQIPAASVVAPVAPAPAAPAKPALMKPIVEEVYIKRDKAAPNAVKAAASPVPPKKPEAPVKSGDDDRTVTPSNKPAATPAPSAAVEESKTPAPVPAEDSRTAPIRDPHVSAIKGPKTMPALPTGEVAAEPLFKAEENPAEPTMFERQQIKAQEEVKKDTAEITPVVPRPKEGVEPLSFDPGEQGALKKSFPFQPGQIRLEEAQTDEIAAGVVKELDGDDKEDWRVQIRSYATPSGTGLASDRRIALNRALSLRTSLIAQGVPAGKIDVMAEGQVPAQGGSATDRIDLYLYGRRAE